MPVVKCKKCKKSFYAKPSLLKKGFGKYCSRNCHHKDMENGKEVSCSTCLKNTYRASRLLEKSKSKKYFCSKSCQTIWRNKEFSGQKHKRWKGGYTLYKNIMIKSGRPQVCEFCGELDHRVLAVHHVDENHKNNTVNNFAWLCFNCHHLVHCDKVEKQKFLQNKNMVLMV